MPGHTTKTGKAVIKGVKRADAALEKLEKFNQKYDRELEETGNIIGMINPVAGGAYRGARTGLKRSAGLRGKARKGIAVAMPQLKAAKGVLDEAISPEDQKLLFEAGGRAAKGAAKAAGRAAKRGLKKGAKALVNRIDMGKRKKIAKGFRNVRDTVAAIRNPLPSVPLLQSMR